MFNRNSETLVWKLITWLKVPLATSLGPKLFFVHMMGSPIASSKIISKWLVLSLHRQLKLQHSWIERVEQWPMVTWTWNCIDKDSLYIANSFAHEQLKATWSKFDANKISLNLQMVVAILNIVTTIYKFNNDHDKIWSLPTRS
jgi:hypothetical protein